jgi:hypothetical protein
MHARILGSKEIRSTSGGCQMHTQMFVSKGVISSGGCHANVSDQGSSQLIWCTWKFTEACCERTKDPLFCFILLLHSWSMTLLLKNDENTWPIAYSHYSVFIQVLKIHDETYMKIKDTNLCMEVLVARHENRVIQESKNYLIQNSIWHKLKSPKQSQGTALEIILREAEIPHIRYFKAHLRH